MERRVAIITASGRGIGAACARLLAAKGYRVALMSRSAGAVTLAHELSGVGIQGSVTKEADLKRLVTVTMESFGRIDSVVNNTGDPASKELLELSDDQWHEDLDLILLNVIRMARLVTPIMIEQGGGSIVNISAADAYEPDARFPIGSTYRAALGAWTKLYADRFAEDGIRMNCVSPGIILPKTFVPDAYESTIGSVPMRRPGTYEEIARVVQFLLSEEASYITGQNVRVDGGLTKYV